MVEGTSRPVTIGRCVIEKTIIGYAYPRNGNVHNPSPKVRWVVTADGRRIGSTGTLKDAKELAAEFNAHPEW